MQPPILVAKLPRTLVENIPIRMELLPKSRIIYQLHVLSILIYTSTSKEFFKHKTDSGCFLQKPFFY
jgi:hypothetical protein